MASTALQQKVGRAFDKVRRKFFSAGTYIEFVKPNANKTDYLVVDFYNESWWLAYDNFMRNSLLQVVDKETMTQTMIESTHIRVVHDGLLQNAAIYLIDRKNVEPPAGAEVNWKIRCDRVLSKATVFTGLR